MRYALTIGIAGVLASVAFAGDESRSIPPPTTEHPATREICDHESRDWSAMRGTLVAISRFCGKNEADVQEIAQKALRGAAPVFHRRVPPVSPGGGCWLAERPAGR